MQFTLHSNIFLKLLIKYNAVKFAPLLNLTYDMLSIVEKLDMAWLGTTQDICGLLCGTLKHLAATQQRMRSVGGLTGSAEPRTSFIDLPLPYGASPLALQVDSRCNSCSSWLCTPCTPSINMRWGAQMERHTKLLILSILSCIVHRLMEFRLK